MAGVPQCFGEFATHIGTTADDVINGRIAHSVIVGKDGNDTLNGKGGDDLICGGPGGDVIDGGGGFNRCDGGPGHDTFVNCQVIIDPTDDLFDPPGNLSANRTPDESGATISWTEPQHTLGVPLANYIITTSPSSQNTTVLAPATTVDITGLNPTKSYVVNIRATTISGQISPAASTTIQEPPHQWSWIQALGGTEENGAWCGFG